MWDWVSSAFGFIGKIFTRDTQRADFEAVYSEMHQMVQTLRDELTEERTRSDRLEKEKQTERDEMITRIRKLESEYNEAVAMRYELLKRVAELEVQLTKVQGALTQAQELLKERKNE